MDIKKLVIVALAVLILGGVGFWFAISKGLINSVVTRNSVDKLIPSLDKAKDLARENKVEDAVAIFEDMKDENTDVWQKAFIDTTLAGLEFNRDRKKSAEMYAAVASNVEYPAKTRAFAIVEFAGLYNGSQDLDLAAPFFTAEELSKYKTVQARYIALCEKSYAFYPFGIAAGEIAMNIISPLTLRFNDPKITAAEKQKITDEAKILSSVYLHAINGNLPDLMPPDPKSNLLPNTLLVKALLLRNLESLNVPLEENASTAFESSIYYAHSLEYKGKEQFATLYYASYLGAKVGNDTKVIELLNNLQKDGVDPAVRGFFTNRAIFNARFPGLITLSKKNTEVKSLLDQLGLAVK